MQLLMLCNLHLKSGQPKPKSPKINRKAQDLSLLNLNLKPTSTCPLLELPNSQNNGLYTLLRGF